MRKRVLFFSIVCLMFVTLNYTYSAFKNTIVGTISGNAKDWVFKVNVDSGTVYNDSYKVHLTGTSGSFNVRISTVGGAKNAEYSIELTSNDLVKYYTDSACTNLIENNIYNGNINSNTSSNVTIYYKASSSINDDVYVKVKGNIMEVAMMKNGYSNASGANGGIEFWNNTYKPYIRTITFENDLSNLPSNCTEENLCFDVTGDGNTKKVYGYLIDSGLKDSNNPEQSLYNLYIVSEAPIFAPQDCSLFFAGFNNLININYNNNFNTSKVTNMSYMFLPAEPGDWGSIVTLTVNNKNVKPSFIDRKNDGEIEMMTSGGGGVGFYSVIEKLDLSNFNTSNVTSMESMFASCSSLTSLDLSNFNTSKVTNILQMFSYCESLTSLDLSSFNTSNVTNMYAMFEGCSSLTSLDLSGFNTSKVTDMSDMFFNCSSLTSLYLSSFNTSQVIGMQGMFSRCLSLTTLDLNGFNTSKVTNMQGMFRGCSSLTNLELNNFNTSNVTNMSFMFSGCSKLQTQINIMNAGTTSYSDMFSNAASDPSAHIIIGYTTETQSIATAMRNTCTDATAKARIELKKID